MSCVRVGWWTGATPAGVGSQLENGNASSIFKFQLRIVFKSRQVVAFDMVDDESKPERRPTKHSPPPGQWNSKHNAAYSYYAYYMYANLFVLNKFRESKGLNTFAFRPHAGEAGDIDHLVRRCAQRTATFF